ncbi:MAG: hypothetical protein RR263_05850, partial [Oscillospiraceae bacterium]
MKYIINTYEFDSRTDRPLFIGDQNAYEVKVDLAQEVTGGILTVSSYRPGMINPKISTSNITGSVAYCTLLTEQYDIEGDTRFICTISDSFGATLTTRTFSAEVKKGNVSGSISSNDMTNLTTLINSV